MPNLFLTMQNPPTGGILSAGLTNILINNGLFLWGCAARTNDVMVGFNVDMNSTLAADVERDAWIGYFQYGGVKTNTLYNSITRTNGRMKVYVQDDGAINNVVFNSRTVSPSSPIDLAAYTFTVGSQYKVRITLTRESGSGDVQCTGRMDFMAILTSNAYAWPTLVTLADATTPTAANLATISQAYNYLNEEAKVPTGQCANVGYIGYAATTTLFANGGFYARGLTNATEQVTLTITYRFQNGTATLKTYAAGSGTVIDSFALTVDAAEHTDAKTLTAGSYTVNSAYRWSVETTSNNNDPTKNYVSLITYGGNKGLTTNPANVAQGDEVRGSTGSKPIAVIGGSGANTNPNDIRQMLRGTSTDNGFQFLAAAHIGTVQFDATTGVAYNIGAPTKAADSSAMSGEGTRFKRTHVWRYLWYLPTAANTSGVMTWGQNKSLSLPDNNNAGWTFADLDAIIDIAPGMVYSVSGVVACFEAQT